MARGIIRDGFAKSRHSSFFVIPAKAGSQYVQWRPPVVVLTTSRAEQDILKTYDLHANCYITKPVDLDQFMGITKAIESFWLTVVKLPESE